MTDDKIDGPALMKALREIGEFFPPERRLHIRLSDHEKLSVSVPKDAPLDKVFDEILNSQRRIIRGHYENVLFIDEPRNLKEWILNTAFGMKEKVAKVFRIFWRATFTRRSTNEKVAAACIAIQTAYEKYKAADEAAAARVSPVKDEKIVH